MKIAKTLIITTAAAMLLSSGLAMAKSAPKATIQINSESRTLTGSENGKQARDVTWHYGDIDDTVIFNSNISIANSSPDVVYTTIEFRGMNIRDDSFIFPGKSVDNITTNFPFKAVHLILRDNFHAVFFDGLVYPNSHFTITPVDTYVKLGSRSENAKPKLQLIRN